MSTSSKDGSFKFKVPDRTRPFPNNMQRQQANSSSGADSATQVFWGQGRQGLPQRTPWPMMTPRTGLANDISVVPFVRNELQHSTPIHSCLKHDLHCSSVDSYQNQRPISNHQLDSERMSAMPHRRFMFGHTIQPVQDNLFHEQQSYCGLESNSSRAPQSITSSSVFRSNLPHSTPMHSFHRDGPGVVSSTTNSIDSSQRPPTAFFERLGQVYLDSICNLAEKDRVAHMLDGLWRCIPKVDAEMSCINGSMSSSRNQSRPGSTWKSQFGGSVRSQRSQDTISNLFSMSSNDPSLKAGSDTSSFVVSYVVGRSGKSHISAKQTGHTKMMQLQETISNANEPSASGINLSVSNKTPGIRNRIPEDTRIGIDDSDNGDTQMWSTDDDVQATVRANKKRKQSRILSRPTAIYKLLDVAPNDSNELQTSVKNTKGGEVKLIATPYDPKPLVNKKRRSRKPVESVSVIKKTVQVVKKKVTKKKINVTHQVSMETTTSVTVSLTRSGRVVRPPILYGCLSSPSRDRSKSPRKATKKGGTDQFKVPVQPPPKKATRSRKKETVAAPVASEAQLKENIPPKAEAKKPRLNVKEKPPTTKPKGRGKKSKTSEVQNTTNSVQATTATPLLDLSSFGGDLFVPEVSSIARKVGGKKRGHDNVGSATPPLQYFTANINPSLISSETPYQATPDWHISQRSPSEVKGLQKENAKSKKTAAKPASKAVKKKKPTKVVKETLKLVSEIQLSARKRQRLVAPEYLTDSETEEV